MPPPTPNRIFMRFVLQPILAAAGFQPARGDAHAPKEPPERRLQARLPAPHSGEPQMELALVRTSEGWPGGQPRTRGSAPLRLGFSTAPLQSLPRLPREQRMVGQNRRGARRREGIVIHSGEAQTFRA